MELLLVPVFLWAVTSQVPTTAASKIPICDPPSPLSCVFPTHARCIYDTGEKKDLWYCENIFTGSLKRPSTKKPSNELQKNTELSNTLRDLPPKKNSKAVLQIKKSVSQPTYLKNNTEKRLKATLDVNESKYHTNAFDGISNTNRAPGTGVYYGLKPYSPYYFYNNIQSPYNSYASPYAYPSALTYYVG